MYIQYGVHSMCCTSNVTCILCDVHFMWHTFMVTYIQCDVHPTRRVFHCEIHIQHSVAQNGGYYAFIGWIINSRNYDLQTEDYNCLAPGLMVPELRMLARLHMLPPLTTCLLASIYFRNSTVLFALLLPMVACRIITLLFNVEYHPTNTQNNIC